MFVKYDWNVAKWLGKVRFLHMLDCRADPPLEREIE